VKARSAAGVALVRTDGTGIGDATGDGEGIGPIGAIGRRGALDVCNALGVGNALAAGNALGAGNVFGTGDALGTGRALGAADAVPGVGLGLGKATGVAEKFGVAGALVGGGRLGAGDALGRLLGPEDGKEVGSEEVPTCGVFEAPSAAELHGTPAPATQAASATIRRSNAISTLGRFMGEGIRRKFPATLSCAGES